MSSNSAFNICSLDGLEGELEESESRDDAKLHQEKVRCYPNLTWNILRLD